MKKTLWYISKYFEQPTQSTPGGRNFLLMNEIAHQGANVVVITSDSNNLVAVPVLDENVVKQSIEQLEVVWLKTFKYQVAKSWRRIASWFDFEWQLLKLDKSSLPKPDAIIVSSLSLLTILNGFLLRRKYKCKLIFEIRDIWPLTLVEEGGFSNRNPFVRFLGAIEYLGYKHSDAIVGTMPNLGAHVKNVLGYEKPTHCIPMGVTKEFADVATDLVAQEFLDQYIPKNKFIVIYAGTIGITNALETYFSCVEKLASNPDIHFLVLGDGALRDTFIHQYGHLKNLTFMPRVAKNQVQSILTKSDLLYFSVYPSKVWDFGQSLNKVIDYMLSGKPILGSYNGYPSMINEAGCGYFVPANDTDKLVKEITAISQLPTEERVNLGMNGKQWLLENRSYPKLAKEYLDIAFE